MSAALTCVCDFCARAGEACSVAHDAGGRGQTQHDTSHPTPSSAGTPASSSRGAGGGRPSRGGGGRPSGRGGKRGGGNAPTKPKTTADLDAEMDAYFRKANPDVAAKKLDAELEEYAKAKAAAKPVDGEAEAAA